MCIRKISTHWARVTQICVSKLKIIGSDNGLAPGRRQAIIWTNAGISLIRPQATNFSEMLIKIHIFSLKKMHLNMSSEKWRPFCFDKQRIQTMNYCPFAWRNHRWPVDSIHKGPTILKAFPCHDIVMGLINFQLHNSDIDGISDMNRHGADGTYVDYRMIHVYFTVL